MGIFVDIGSVNTDGLLGVSPGLRKWSNPYLRICAAIAECHRRLHDKRTRSVSAGFVLRTR
jgi:hypothetical protein